MRWVLLENAEVYVYTTLVRQRLKAIFPQKAEKEKGKVLCSCCVLSLSQTSTYGQYWRHI